MSEEEKPQQPPPDEDAYLTIEEVAQKLGATPQTIRRYVRKYDIPHIRLGHQFVRIHWPTAKAYLEKRGKYGRNT